MPDEMLTLSRLESELGLSRAEILVLAQRIGITPERRGLRTFLRASDVSRLRAAATGKGGELVATELELVQAHGESDASSVPVVSGESNWMKAEQFADLRLFRERLEILEQLVRTGIEVGSRELADLLQLRRLPPLQDLCDGKGFERRGLRCLRIQRPGQRSSWRLVKAAS